MDQKILSELGDYLLAHREDIIGEWLRAVKQSPDISSVDHLKDKEELADHLPELCQNLAELSSLRNRIKTAPRYSVLRESMADTAGDKVTGSRKSYARRASSEELFPIAG